VKNATALLQPIRSITTVVFVMIAQTLTPTTNMKRITMMTARDIEFQSKVAKRFLSKKSDAERRGIEFTLSLRSIENLLSAKHCYYTGFLLTENSDSQGHQVATGRTIDRIDSSKGYIKGNVVACCYAANIKGNVVACCYAANQLKAMVEGGGFKGYELGQKIFAKTIKRINQAGVKA